MFLVLLSGGLDSAVNLAEAAEKTSLALTVRYGQRAEKAELAAAESLARHYGVEWHSVDLRWLGEVNPTALTRTSQNLPALNPQELDDPILTNASARAVWVANRNGVFLNVAAAYAEALGIDTVLAGFNREEAVTFPDNGVDFLEAVNKSLSYSTLKPITVDALTKDWDKTQILKRALDLKLPLELVWSCYEAGPERCWKCESCKRTMRGLKAHGEEGRETLGKMGFRE